MSILGEKCSSCGRRTRHRYANAPTCEACAAGIETRLAAQREAVRSCPLDQKNMVKEVVSGIIVDRCPACQGVWLDSGELELLRARVAQDVAQGFVGRLTTPF